MQLFRLEKEGKKKGELKENCEIKIIAQLDDYGGGGVAEQCMCMQACAPTAVTGRLCRCRLKCKNEVCHHDMSKS